MEPRSPYVPKDVWIFIGLTAAIVGTLILVRIVSGESIAQLFQ